MLKEKICQIFGHTYSNNDGGWKEITQIVYTKSYTDGCATCKSDKPFPVIRHEWKRTCARCGITIFENRKPIEVQNMENRGLTKKRSITRSNNRV